MYSESTDCENFASLALHREIKCIVLLISSPFLSVSSLFQVDLLVPTKVTGIITQGAKDFGHVQFVGSYKLAYSNDGERWSVYQDEKQRKDKVRSFHSQ